MAIAMLGLLFGDVGFTSELYGIVGGLVVLAVLQLAWRTTRVRDQRIIAHGTIVLVERQRVTGAGNRTGADGVGGIAASGTGGRRWRSRVRTCEWARMYTVNDHRVEILPILAVLCDEVRGQTHRTNCPMIESSSGTL